MQSHFGCNSCGDKADKRICCLKIEQLFVFLSCGDWKVPINISIEHWHCGVFALMLANSWKLRLFESEHLLPHHYSALAVRQSPWFNLCQLMFLVKKWNSTFYKIYELISSTPDRLYVYLAPWTDSGGVGQQLITDPKDSATSASGCQYCSWRWKLTD